MSEATGTVAREVEETRRPSAALTFLKRLVTEKPLGFVGALILLLMLLTGIFADYLAPYPYDEIHILDRLEGPSSTYLLGTDGTGRDMLSRVIYGARISMIVGITATALSTAISTLLGLSSGYIGGKFDIIVQRFVDAWICFPWLVVYLLILSLIGRGIPQLIFVLALGGIGGSRGSRALAFWIKESVYVEATRAMGGSTWRVIWRHLLPNVLPMIIIGFTMGMGGVILAEASLSFLGFGIPPPFPTWGQEISGLGRHHMIRAPWIPLFPGLALTLAVYGVNMFGDAMRDLLDPRLRGGVGGLGEYGAEQAKKALAKKQARVEKAQQDADLR